MSHTNIPSIYFDQLNQHIPVCSTDQTTLRPTTTSTPLSFWNDTERLFVLPRCRFEGKQSEAQYESRRSKIQLKSCLLRLYSVLDDRWLCKHDEKSGEVIGRMAVKHMAFRMAYKEHLLCKSVRNEVYSYCTVDGEKACSFMQMYVFNCVKRNLRIHRHFLDSCVHWIVYIWRDSRLLATKETKCSHRVET